MIVKIAGTFLTRIYTNILGDFQICISVPLRVKPAKDHEVRMLQMKTQNKETMAQRLLLEQYHHHQQQQQQTQQQMLLLLQNQQQEMMALFEKLSKKGE